MESILLGKDLEKARFKDLDIKSEFGRESRSWGRGNKQTKVNSSNGRTNRNWHLGAPSRTKKIPQLGMLCVLSHPRKISQCWCDLVLFWWVFFSLLPL